MPLGERRAGAWFFDELGVWFHISMADIVQLEFVKNLQAVTSIF